MANIYGTNFNDTLNGTVFADNIYAYAGNDKVYAKSGNDIVYGGTGDDTLKGEAGNDKLYGEAGNDLLDGGTGNDYLAGGAGNDKYYVDSASDAVSEAAGAGTDTVYSWAGSYTLPANVENLSLMEDPFVYDTVGFNGTGNDLNNTIYGNDWNNTLFGLGGNDALYGQEGADKLYGGAGNDILDGGKDPYPSSFDYLDGGSGNDTYYVDLAGDKVYEAAGAGTDKVFASVSYTLSANVEDLYLTGAAANGTGNTGGNGIYGNGYANTLRGNSGADGLWGYGGNDTLYGDNDKDGLYGGTGIDKLYGGSGNDWFFFADKGTVNKDTIYDFSHTYDTIGLQDKLDGVANGAIKGLTFSSGVLSASKYFEGAGFTGNGAQASGIFNDTNTGNIYYNPTSGTAGDSYVICTVGSAVAKSLDYTDFTYSA